MPGSISQEEVDELLKDFRLPLVDDSSKTTKRPKIVKGREPRPTQIKNITIQNQINFKTYRPSSNKVCPYCNKKMEVIMMCRDYSTTKYLLYCSDDYYYQNMSK